MKLKKTILNGQTVYIEVPEDDVDGENVEVIKIPKIDLSGIPHAFHVPHPPKKEAEDEDEDEEHDEDEDEDEAAEEKSARSHPTTKTAKLLRMLPFLEPEDIHDLLDKILANDESVKGLNAAAIMPFLEDEDCDRLFLKMLETGGEVTMSLVPFVSDSCLGNLVDAYIGGKYPNLDVDELYPFLDAKSLKKLLRYELEKDQ